MKGYNPVGGIFKIIFLLILIGILILGGFLWLDFLGVMDVKDSLAPVRNIFGMDTSEPKDTPDDLYLLEKDRIEKEREALELEREQLITREEALTVREAELEQLANELTEKENLLTEKEKSLNQASKSYENKRDKLEKSAEYLNGMAPQNAVDILLETDEREAVTLLETVERMAEEAGQQSMVSYWLSLMPPDRAAVLQRLMTMKPGE